MSDKNKKFDKNKGEEQPKVIPHNCEDYMRYTFGPLDWGWYCPICGAFAPEDDVAGEQKHF